MQFLICRPIDNPGVPAQPLAAAIAAMGVGAPGFLLGGYSDSGGKECAHAEFRTDSLGRSAFVVPARLDHLGTGHDVCDCGCTLGVLAVSNAAPVAATTPQTSMGTDFWVTFESNCTFNGCGTPPGPGNLFLFISGSTATTGTVTVPGISFSQTFSVTPGTATEVQLPSTAEDDVSDSVEPDGVHITAGSPVSAYGLNTLEYTTDGYLGLPTDILGTSYIVEGYGSGFGSQFAVVGTTDGTTVTITPSEDVDGTYTAGTPYTETLNQGDVYQLVDTGGGRLVRDYDHIDAAGRRVRGERLCGCSSR